MAIKIILSGRTFESKKDAENAVREEIKSHLRGQEFTSSLIADLIATRHWYCSRHALRPVLFRMTLDRGDNSAGAYQFFGLFPGIGWHKVSWKNCLYQPTWDGEKRALMRRLVADEMERYRLSHYQCEICGKCTPPLHCHHKYPLFSDMAIAVDQLFSDSDRLAWLGREWKDDADFSLPTSHPTVIEFLRLHADAQMTVLCLDCHKKFHKKNE